MKLLDHHPETTTPVRRRRAFTVEFKRALVEQALVRGASVSGIALANDLNTNLLFSWCRQFAGSGSASSGSTLLPVRLHLGLPTRAAPSVLDGRIEIRIKTATLTLHGQVDADALRVVLQCLLP